MSISYAEPNEKNIPFQVISASLPKVAEKPFCAVVRSKEEWNKLLDTQLGTSDKARDIPASVDFTKVNLLIASGGYQPNFASINFDSVLEGDETIRAHATLVLPGSCPRLPEIGHPLRMILIAKSMKPVFCNLRSIERDCTGK